VPHADPTAAASPSALPAQRSPLLRRARTGVVAILGAATLATGTAVAADPVGGASSEEAAAAPAATQAAAVTLKPGSRGALVRRLQRKLRVRADGHFGSRTRAALRRWQRRHGLRADGIAGPTTLAALRVIAKAADAPVAPAAVPAVLERIARCESGGNPAAVSAGGLYRGKYQFSRDTWRTMGGAGDDPAQAPEAEQDRIAAALYAAEGLKPWPACGRGA
jgi:hypothetical protein